MALAGWTYNKAAIPSSGGLAAQKGGSLTAAPPGKVSVSMDQVVSPDDPLYGRVLWETIWMYSQCCVNCGICWEEVDIADAAQARCQSYCAQYGVGGFAMSWDCSDCTVLCQCQEGTLPVA